MLDILGRFIKTFYSGKNYIFMVAFSSPQNKKRAVRNCFKKIRRSKRLFERERLRWEGYFCHDGSPEYEDLVIAAFVLTKRRIYVAYELRSEMNLEAAEITPETAYDFSEADYDDMMSIALLNPFIYFWHDKDETFSEKLKKKLHRMGIRPLREVFEDIFSNEKRSA